MCSRELRPDLILRLETLETRDLPAYLRLLGLPSSLSSKLPHLVVGRGQVVGATRGRQVEAAFYGQLSRDAVRGLFQYYRPDHELFGYSPRRFIQYASARES